MVLEACKAAGILFVAAIVQASVLNGFSLAGGTPDLVLVVLVAVALLRGSTYGAAVGFFAGLVLDTATLETLGVTSLLLTLAGYWIGRYGETTGRDRAHAPLVSVAVITVLYAIGALALRYMLGENTSAPSVFDALLPEIVFNVVLAVPVYALGRRLLGPREGRRVPDMELVG
jgi:rod shape-determining protein MreD